MSSTSDFQLMEPDVKIFLKICCATAYSPSVNGCMHPFLKTLTEQHFDLFLIYVAAVDVVDAEKSLIAVASAD